MIVNNLQAKHDIIMPDDRSYSICGEAMMESDYIEENGRAAERNEILKKRIEELEAKIADMTSFYGKRIISLEEKNTGHNGFKK